MLCSFSVIVDCPNVVLHDYIDNNPSMFHIVDTTMNEQICKYRIILSKLVIKTH